MSTAPSINGRAARFTIAPRRKKYVPLEEQAEKVFAIAIGLLAEGKKVTKSEISRRLGYTHSGGGELDRHVAYLKQRGRWPVTEAMLPGRQAEPVATPVAPAYIPADEPFVTPPDADDDELATLCQIRQKLDGLTVAARQLVKSWL
jgi:hypothetical protein